MEITGHKSSHLSTHPPVTYMQQIQQHFALPVGHDGNFKAVLTDCSGPGFLIVRWLLACNKSHDVDLSMDPTIAFYTLISQLQLSQCPNQSIKS